MLRRVVMLVFTLVPALAVAAALAGGGCAGTPPANKDPPPSSSASPVAEPKPYKVYFAQSVKSDPATPNVVENYIVCDIQLVSCSQDGREECQEKLNTQQKSNDHGDAGEQVTRSAQSQCKSKLFNSKKLENENWVKFEVCENEIDEFWGIGLRMCKTTKPQDASASGPLAVCDADRTDAGSAKCDWKTGLFKLCKEGIKKRGHDRLEFRFSNAIAFPEGIELDAGATSEDWRLIVYKAIAANENLLLWQPSNLTAKADDMCREDPYDAGRRAVPVDVWAVARFRWRSINR